MEIEILEIDNGNRDLEIDNGNRDFRGRQWK